MTIFFTTQRGQFFTPLGGHFSTPIDTEAYYTAFGEKNIAEMGKYLHSNLHFLSPLVEMSGKEAFLEAAERFFTLFKSLTIRAKFGSQAQAMIVYYWDCLPPVGVSRTSALLTFEDDLISRIELFFDARPFEKR